MLPEPLPGFRVSPRVLSALDAIRAAAENVGISLTVAPDALNAPEGLTERVVWSSTPDFRADEPITTELIYFPRTRSDIRTAWSVLIPEKGIGNPYEMLVDATTGEVLRRWNRLHFFGGSQDATFRVFTEDSPAPGTPGTPTASTTQFPTVSRSLVTVTGASVAAASPNGWIDDGNNETVGNNVDAHTDLNADNVPDTPRPQGSPFRTFDFALDLANSPLNSSAAAITNLFYLTNVYHDLLYSLGFDEPARNFQQNNFGNGGTGNDRVTAQAQDGATAGNPQFFNNANFSTSGSDGSTGRCQMYLFNSPTPDRDGSFESDIVYHELSHGLSIRLSGGTVSGEQSGGMGEGWGDFFGLAINGDAGDDLNGVYPTGAYVTYLLGGQQTNYYWGIRRLPYSTNTAVNPYTYADIDPAQYSAGVLTNPIIGVTPDAVHNVGEIWCLTLWECRANMINALGFSANNEMMRLVVDGLKLMPSNPNMLQARDAILQSDLVVNGGSNSPYLWNGFAKRGMGLSASSPSGSTTTGVVEAFDTPASLTFDYPLGRPAQLQPFATATFRVDVGPLGGVTPISGTGQLVYRVNGGALQTVAMTQVAPNSYDATLPAGECFDVVEYFVRSDSTGGIYQDPGVGSFRTAVVFESANVALADDFQTNLGWTVATTATDGGWNRGVPQDNGRGNPPSHFDGSGICYLTDNDLTTTNSDVDSGTTTLTSPVLDMSQGGTISWAYWLNDVSTGQLTPEDTLDVEYATNAAGSNWQPLRSYGTASAAWRQDEVTVGSDLPASATLRIRFIAQDLGAQNVVEAGIDAFVAQTLTCVGIGAPFCFGDGTATFCPCGNDTFPGEGTGCVNSSGLGALLVASGVPSVTADTLRFDVTGATPTSFASLVSGQNALNGGNGNPAFDGLRCVGGSLVRHGTRALDFDGNNAAPWGAPGGPAGGLLAQGGFSAGQTRYFQVFFRETNTLGRLTRQNTSNGFSVIVRP